MVQYRPRQLGRGSTRPRRWRPDQGTRPPDNPMVAHDSGLSPPLQWRCSRPGSSLCATGRAARSCSARCGSPAAAAAASTPRSQVSGAPPSPAPFGHGSAAAPARLQQWAAAGDCHMPADACRIMFPDCAPEELVAACCLTRGKVGHLRNWDHSILESGSMLRLINWGRGDPHIVHPCSMGPDSGTPAVGPNGCRVLLASQCCA